MQGNLGFYDRHMLAGVDEAGRGPLAGPVVAAAVVVDPARPLDGVADSKTLQPKRREELARRIRQEARCWSIAWADPGEIDVLNILEASMLAMRRAIVGLRVKPRHVQVDGNRCPRIAGIGVSCTVEAIVRGDATVPAISAASILAKEFRDRLMHGLHSLYPSYGFDRHKGYPTREHVLALEKHGPCPVHRRTFRPVRELVRHV